MVKLWPVPGTISQMAPGTSLKVKSVFTCSLELRTTDRTFSPLIIYTTHYYLGIKCGKFVLWPGLRL